MTVYQGNFQCRSFIENLGREVEYFCRVAVFSAALALGEHFGAPVQGEGTVVGANVFLRNGVVRLDERAFKCDR